MVICFSCKTYSYKKRETSQVIFQLNVVHSLATKLLQKNSMKNQIFLASRRLQSYPNATIWH
jgi:hypothetical protein